MKRRVMLFLVAALAIVGLALAQVPGQGLFYLGGDDPWWRPLNPQGQSYGITVGSARPSPAMNGEIFLDMDGAADGGPFVEVYDGTNDEWDRLGLDGISITAAATGDILVHDGTNWVDVAFGTPAITANAAGDILMHNGTNWVDATTLTGNYTLSGTNLMTGTFDISTLTDNTIPAHDDATGNLIDSRITDDGTDIGMTGTNINITSSQINILGSNPYLYFPQDTSEFYIAEDTDFDSYIVFDGAPSPGSGIEAVVVGGSFSVTANTGASGANAAINLQSSAAAGATTATGGLTQVTGGFPLLTGANTAIGVQLDFTNVDHTGGSLSGLNLASLGGTGPDADATETAINIESGWDLGINLAAPADANLDAGNYLQGLVRMEMLALGVLTDGTTGATEILIDDTPAGEWTEVDAGTEVTTDFTETAVVRKGTNSMQVTWTDSAIDGDGVINALGADEDWEGLESIGLWHRCTTTTVAGDIELNLTEVTGDVQFNLPAIAVADTWEWVEVDIAALAGGTGDAVVDLEIQLSGQGVAAAQAFDCFFDFGFLWDLADETAISRDIVVDGVVSLVTVVDAQGTANLSTNRVEGTDYIVNYQSGDDVIVNVANNSTFTAIVLVFLAEDPNP